LQRQAAIFRQIEYGSAYYRQALCLRETVLRAPLGLTLGEADLRGEDGQLHFGLFAGDRIIACVVAVPVSAAEAKIRQTAVEPAHQRQGLASAMMRQLEADLAARGIRRLSLHARTGAIGFYEKLGYQAEGEEFVEVTMPHRKMVKRLA